MQIDINGKPSHFENPMTLEEVLERLSIRKDIGFAVALNATVVSKSLFPETQLKDGDKLEIIQATAGG